MARHQRAPAAVVRALACAAALWCSTGQAQEWPQRAVTLIAPFAPGGTVDIAARIVAQKLAADLGHGVVVENRGGAGGTIGTALLARAQPDGHTLMVHHMGLAFNATLYDKLPFDTGRDVLALGQIGTTPNVLVVTNGFPVKSVAGFLALARARPDSVNYGSGGPGSAGHLPMEVLQAATGIRLQHVPYKGSGPALVDLISGQIQAMLLTIPAVMPYIQAGKVRALATSGRRRTPALAALPTLDEAGVKGFEYAPWFGVFAPAGTPPALLAKMHVALNRVLADPEIVDRLGQQGLEVQAQTREQFAAQVRADIGTWAKTIRALGVKGE
jgi:tripartite-type tricarboxylate transporter receptor subunit TctC